MSGSCGSDLLAIVPALLIEVWAPHHADAEGRSSWEKTLSLSFFLSQETAQPWNEGLHAQLPGGMMQPWESNTVSDSALEFCLGGPGWRAQKNVHSHMLSSDSQALCFIFCSGQSWYVGPLLSTLTSTSVRKLTASCMMGEWWQPSPWWQNSLKSHGNNAFN